MRQEGPAPRKLGEIGDREGIVPFLLAIAKGADINEKRKGKPLVQFYFQYIWRCGNMWVEPVQVMLKKLKCLLALGADTKTIIRDDYQDMVLSVSRQLMLLALLLESDSAKTAIRWYKEHCHPHQAIIIADGMVRLVTDEMGVPFHGEHCQGQTEGERRKRRNVYIWKIAIAVRDVLQKHPSADRIACAYLDFLNAFITAQAEM